MVRLTTEARCTKNPATREKTVNQYRLFSEIGRGTYSKVRWAEDNESGCFAVKSFSKCVLERKHVSHFDEHGASTVPLKVRIQSELQILGDTDHRHIVRLVEVIDDPQHEKLYAIFDGLAGGQLMVWDDDCTAYGLRSDPNLVRQHWGDAVSSANAAGGPQGSDIAVYQEPVAAYLFRQLLEGTQYLHERGVIHKDLKPDNILLSKPVPSADPRFARRHALDAGKVQGQAEAGAGNAPPPTSGLKGDFVGFLGQSSLVLKIGDFNTSAVCPQPDCLIYDAEGTQQFCPPECFFDSHGGVRGKPRDMWSIGCVLFTMLLGRCPFWADVNIQLQLSIMQDELAIPGGVVSPQAESLINQLVCKDPQCRLSASTALGHTWCVAGQGAD
mmetsp:Transcript_72336/g.204426  ORF Transcript_72336/g.204426 Transcript_72336/m.204426 type:complete len:385 (+) Transcript_72336:70-1224(+)